MTALPKWIVTRTRGLPSDPRLRKAAEEARLSGREWTIIVATPPPVRGRVARRAREALVVGHRAARVHFGRVEWGRWDEEQELIHLDRGVAVDLAGRRAKVPVDIEPIPPGERDVSPRLPRWLVRVAGGLFTLFFVEVLVVLSVLPFPPTTSRGWILLLVFGPPAYVALEWLGGRIFNREVGSRISPAPFSWARIVIAVAVLLVLLVPLMWWSLAHAA